MQVERRIFRVGRMLQQGRSLKVAPLPPPEKFATLRFANFSASPPGRWAQEMDLRILMVTVEYPPQIGGIGSHVSELARALEPLVGEVRVVHPLGARQSSGVTLEPRPSRASLEGDAQDARAPGLTPWKSALPVGVIMAEPFYQWTLHFWLRRHLARAPADIVHVHGMRPLGATKNLQAHVMFTNHSSGFLARLNASSARKQRTARLLRNVEFLIGPSDELVAAARSFGYAGPAEMIPNGVDVERFSPGRSRLRADWGLAQDEVAILLARRLVPKNGVADFARALALLGPGPWHAVVAGDGPERAGMMDILRRAGLLAETGRRVRFLGAVSNSEMPDLYRACDIAVLPSLAEATSIAGLEAMASGLPLVGTSVGGIPSIIAENRTGLLVPPASPAELARALGELIADANLGKRFGAAARERAVAEFSWPTIARRTAEVYRGLS